MPISIVYIYRSKLQDLSTSTVPLASGREERNFFTKIKLFSCSNKPTKTEISG